MFHKTKPELLAASLPLLVLAKVEIAVNMCLAQHEAGRKFVFSFVVEFCESEEIR